MNTGPVARVSSHPVPTITVTIGPPDPGVSQELHEKRLRSKKILDRYYVLCDQMREKGETRVVAALQSIEISQQTARALKRKYPDEPLGQHPGYERVARELEKARAWARQLALCEQAQAQGWAGDWQRRIDRCRKKLGRGG